MHLLRSNSIHYIYFSIETIAYVFSCILSNLAQNESAQLRLYDEVKTYDDDMEYWLSPGTPIDEQRQGAQTCTYLMSVIKETLRLYPIVQL